MSIHFLECVLSQEGKIDCIFEDIYKWTKKYMAIQCSEVTLAVQWVIILMDYLKIYDRMWQTYAEKCNFPLNIR